MWLSIILIIVVISLSIFIDSLALGVFGFFSTFLIGFGLFTVIALIALSQFTKKQKNNKK